MLYQLFNLIFVLDIILLVAFLSSQIYWLTSLWKWGNKAHLLSSNILSVTRNRLLCRFDIYYVMVENFLVIFICLLFVCLVAWSVPWAVHLLSFIFYILIFLLKMSSWKLAFFYELDRGRVARESMQQIYIYIIYIYTCVQNFDQKLSNICVISFCAS